MNGTLQRNPQAVRKFRLTYDFRSPNTGKIVSGSIVAAAPTAEDAIAMRNPETCFNIKAEEVDPSTPHVLECMTFVEDKPAKPEGFQGQWIGGRYYSWERLMSE